MKILIVYYSLTGNTEFIAQKIAKAVGGDLLKLEPEEEIDSKGFMKFIWGGKAVYTKKCPKLLPLNKDPKDYDLLFIGTPVWAWTFAPALRSFFSDVKLASKKIALFCCHDGGKGKIFQKIEEQLLGNEIIGAIDFKRPLKSDKDIKGERAIEWAKEFCL